MLCAGHHDCIDNGTRYEGLRLRDGVTEGAYFIEDRDTGEVLRRIPVGAIA